MENVKTSFITKEKLPLVIEPKINVRFETLLEMIRENKNYLKEQLLKHGGILLRNFPVVGASGFNSVVEALGLGHPLNYIGGETPRDKVSAKVYTSTEAPPSFKIPLHNEMSFVKNYPKHAYFYCEQPPETGGETIIADARQIYTSMDEDIKKKFTVKGLKYVTNFYGKSPLMDLINKFQRAHKTWMDAFETKDKKEVEKLCLANEFGYKWMKNDWLQVVYERPSILVHPETKETVWFNQAHLYDYNPKLIGKLNWLGTKVIYCRKHTIMHEIFFGDGSPVPKKDLYKIMDTLDDKTVKFTWKKGDVLILDNILAMHGKAPFTGKRRILVALTR